MTIAELRHTLDLLCVSTPDVQVTNDFPVVVAYPDMGVGGLTYEGIDKVELYSDGFVIFTGGTT